MSDSNPDVTNPYVWVQIEVPRAVFGPLSHALLEYRLYIGASRRPAEPQFEPRRKESLRLGSNRGAKRGGSLQTLYWDVKATSGAPI